MQFWKDYIVFLLNRESKMPLYSSFVWYQTLRFNYCPFVLSVTQINEKRFERALRFIYENIISPLNTPFSVTYVPNFVSKLWNLWHVKWISNNPAHIQYLVDVKLSKYKFRGSRASKCNTCQRLYNITSSKQNRAILEDVWFSQIGTLS